ncbi:glycosyltransferase [Desulfobaculum sp. SPO524]|uniref:glycosyltransferase n=1 Tax=Desulfobaculum sp. SPO524 TaxID=3378071 RepID=UPI00385296C3
MTTSNDDIRRLAKRLQLDPNGFESNLALGLLHFRREEYADALTRLLKAIDQRETPELVLFTGALAHETGQADTAGRLLERAVALAPDDADAHAHLGRYRAAQGDMSGAREHLERALALRPDDAELHNDIGVAAYSLGDLPAARRALERATQLAPQQDTFRANLGYVLVSLGEVDAATAIVTALEGEGAEDEAHRLREAIAAPGAPAASPGEPPLSSRLGRISPMSMIGNFGEGAGEKRPALSVIVPVYNEAGNITSLYKELAEVLGALHETCEIIFIDDGSTDGSDTVLAATAENDPRVKVIEFRRNYGQTAALSAGFKYCRGDIVITLDGDLQNDPHDIPRLLETMAEGYDLVNGWRKYRKDAALTRRLPSWVANRIINKLIEGTGVQLRDYGCTLKAYKRGIIKNIRLYGEMHRFIPVFAAWLGVRVAEIEVHHRPRIHGEAKYGLSRVLRVVLDLIVVRFFSDYMTRPIHFFGKIAWLTSGAGLGGVALLALLKGTLGLGVSWGILLVLAALALISGVHIVFMGLIGELLIRSYFEGQHKDQFVVRRVRGE